MTSAQFATRLAFFLLLAILFTPSAQATCTQPSSDDPSDWEAYEDCLAEEEDKEAEDDTWTDQDQNAADLADAMAEFGLPQAVSCFEDCADRVVDSYDVCAETAEVCVAQAMYKSSLGQIRTCIQWAAICVLWETVNVIANECTEVCE